MFTKLVTRSEFSYMRFGNAKINCVMGTKTTDTFSRNIKNLFIGIRQSVLTLTPVMRRKGIPIRVK